MDFPGNSLLEDSTCVPAFLHCCCPAVFQHTEQEENWPHVICRSFGNTGVIILLTLVVGIKNVCVEV